MIWAAKMRTRDRAYLNWVSTLKCLACGKPAILGEPNDPDHINAPMQGIKAGKAPDSQVLPLCRKCHTERHAVGVKSFYEGILGRSVTDAIELSKRLYDARFKDGLAKWLFIGWAQRRK